MRKPAKETTRRSFIRAAAATGLVIGASGKGLAGCNSGEHDCPEDMPGNNHAEPPGHLKDEQRGDPGGAGHDEEEDPERKPGERIGHCKYDPKDND